MNVVDFFAMVEGKLSYERKMFDREMQRTAWQTSHIMNSSGNYKRAIKPEKLYKSPNSSKSRKLHTKESAEKERQKLKKIFRLE